MLVLMEACDILLYNDPTQSGVRWQDRQEVDVASLEFSSLEHLQNLPPLKPHSHYSSQLL